MHITPISSLDSLSIASLDSKLFPNNCFNETTLRREIELGEGWVAWDNDLLVAYLLARKTGDLLDILRLGVCGSKQRHGIGTELLKRTFDNNKVMLCVRKTNKQAMKLYRRHDFEIVGVLNASWVMVRSHGHSLEA